MTAAGGQWTLGVLIGLPIVCLVALILLVGIGVAIWLGATTPRGNRTPAFGTAAGLTVALALFAGGMVWAYWPLKAEYHQYRSVSGTVQTIASRLVTAGDKGGSNQKFVVTLTSGPQQYGVEDTRAALLHPGDHVALRCIRKWSYGSNAAGYDCKWGQ